MLVSAFVGDGTSWLRALRAILLDQRQLSLFATSALLALGAAVAATIIGVRLPFRTIIRGRVVACAPAVHAAPGPWLKFVIADRHAGPFVSAVRTISVE